MDFSGAYAPPTKLKPKSLFEFSAPSFDDSTDIENTHTTGESPTNAAYVPTGSQPTSNPTVSSAYTPPGGVLGPNIGQNKQPNLVNDIYAPRLRDVTDKLESAYAPPQVGGFRSVLGALLSSKHPAIGGLISGETQRQREIQPLQQEYGLLTNAIGAQRAAQTSDATLAKDAAETGYYNAHAQAILNPHQVPKIDTPDEQAMSALLKTTNPDTGKPYDAYQARVKLAQGIADTKPDKTPGEKEQDISDYIAANKLPNTAASREKARGAIAGRNRVPRDPELADLNKQLKQAQLDSLQGKADAVSPATQKILQSTVPTIEQVDRLLDTLDPVKNDNTPFSSLGGRLKYAAGIGATEGDKQAGDIQRQLGEMEMDRVIAGARVLQGSSRAYQALQLAMKHAPDPWTDSKALMHQKLTTIRQNLQDVADDAVKYGKKSGQIPAIPGPRQSATPATGGMILARDPNGVLHEAPAGTPIPAGWKPE